MKAGTISAFAGKGSPIGIPTGIDWAQADFGGEAGRKELIAAINEYFGEVRTGMKTTRPGHIPGTLPDRPDIDVRFYGPRLDAGLMQLFREVDKRSSNNPTYQFANVSASSIIFEQKLPGESVKVRKVTGGAPTPITSVTWHGALGIDDDARRFDDYGIFEENVQRVPSAWENKRIDNLATLVTSLSAGINQTWDTNLIKTINKAGAQILSDCGDIYGVDRPTFALVFNPLDWSEVQKALISNFTLPNNNSAHQLQWDILPIQTRKVASGSMYLALPGYDMVVVTWDDLYSEHGRDYERGTDALVWRARENAGIGNVEQLRRITPQ